MTRNADPQNMNFLPYRADESAEAIHRIIDGCKTADSIDPHSSLEPLPSVEELREWLAATDPQDIMLVEVEGQTVGYNRLLWWNESDEVTLYLHLGHVLQEFRGRGLGTALLQWSEARIRALSAAQTSTAIFGANASSTETDATQLLLDNGYQVSFAMAEMAYRIPDDLKPISIPEGIEIRRAQPQDAEKMWRAQQAAYEAIPLVGDPVPDDSDIDELRRDIQERGQLWRIAWAGDEIAAQIWCSVRDSQGIKIGVLDEVHTVPHFQRQGIGRVLIHQVLSMFSEMDIHEARLQTLDDNRRGAKTFYEMVGFRTLKTFPRYRKAL